MDQTHIKVRVVESTRGELRSETDLANIKTILFHEHLTPAVHQLPCNLPLSL
jgi:hypothetical protein